MNVEITNVIVVVSIDGYLLDPLSSYDKDTIGRIILTALQVPEEKELMKYLFSKYENIDNRFWYQIEHKLSSVVTDDMFIANVQFRCSNTIVFIFKKYT